MKKKGLIISFILLLAAINNKAHAQFLGTFSIDAVVGLPDTVNANATYSFGFIVRNSGNTTYSGSLNFDFFIDSLNGSIFSFGAGQTGGFLPGDTITIPISYNFSISNNTFNIGDNVVVVWPRGLIGSTAVDSLTFHVYVTNLNGIDENGKTNSDVKIFPNPSTDFVSFTSDKNKIEGIQIYDMSGRLVLRSESHLKIFTGNFTYGVYVAEVKFSDGVITRKKIIAGNKGE